MSSYTRLINLFHPSSNIPVKASVMAAFTLLFHSLYPICPPCASFLCTYIIVFVHIRSSVLHVRPDWGVVGEMVLLLKVRYKAWKVRLMSGPFS